MMKYFKVTVLNGLDKKRRDNLKLEKYVNLFALCFLYIVVTAKVVIEFIYQKKWKGCLAIALSYPFYILFVYLLVIKF